MPPSLWLRSDSGQADVGLQLSCYLYGVRFLTWYPSSAFLKRLWNGTGWSPFPLTTACTQHRSLSRLLSKASLRQPYIWIDVLLLCSVGNDLADRKILLEWWSWAHLKSGKGVEEGHHLRLRLRKSTRAKKEVNRLNTCLCWHIKESW